MLEGPRLGRRRKKKPSSRKESRPFFEAMAVSVRTRRIGLSLTVREASDRAGIHWRHWQKLEACEGNPTLETLARVAKGLGVELLALLRSVSR